MLKKLTFSDRVTFFYNALKKHLVLYSMSIFFLFTFGGIGLMILSSNKELDIPSLIGAWAYISVGIGIFVLIFYLNISSMLDIK